MSTRQNLTLLWICLLLAIPCSAEVIFVDTDAPGANNGNSWADAYNYLRDALAAASSGDEVRVAEGIYKPDQGDGITPGDREATFQLINGVAIKGGYAGFGEPYPNARDIELYETILNGDLNGDDGPDFANNGENSHSVVTGRGIGATAILDGFTITAGNAYGSYGGGGMYNWLSSPTLTNCAFIGNSAGDERSYSRDGGGGGMYNSNSNPMLVNCIFSGNLSFNDKGGGMRNFGSSSPTLVNCTFSGNSSNNNGGGIYNDAGSPTLTNCILWGNSDIGGADESAQVHTDSGTTTINYSCIQGLDIFTGGGNIGDDPLFMDAHGTDNLPGTEDDNLRLWPGSPCADAGNNSAVPPAVLTDLDGDPRFVDDPDAPDTGNGTPPIVDMGAYEGPKQGFLVSTKSIIVPEGGTATFTVALAMDPLGTVQVTVAHVSGDPDITVESGVRLGGLTFDSSNYSQPQTVTLAAAEDWDSFYGTATIQVSAPGFAAYAVIANEGDNESAPNVFYVDGTNGDDNNDGLTRETAFATIQRGIDIAQRDGDIVLVADGTYASEGWQNNPVIDFRGKAITVRSENGPENCILYRGDYVVRFNSGETAASVLSGFTITGADPGAGICCYDSSPTIMNNIITDNWSEYGLGAVWLHNSSAVVVGNIISGNAVYGPCAGIFCCHGSSGTITNNTIVDNDGSSQYFPYNGAVHCTDDSTATITNCILWSNGDYDLYNCSATYSCTEHGEAGVGNIHTDPMFVNPDGGDYHLQSGSPCIDAGDNSAVLPSMVVDIDGNSRISNGTVDMGAYEFVSPAPPSTLFVDSRATGANNGSSWVDAFTDLQQALAAATASSEVEEIRVAQGVYTPAEPSGDRTATFQLINGVAIKGGYAGASSGDAASTDVGEPDPDARDINAYETILSGDLNGNDIGDLYDESRAENTYHVVTGSATDANTVLDGFTITGGNANGPGSNDDGGGMYNESGNPTVTNCTFKANSAAGQYSYGGGMYSSGNPTLINCTFTGNAANDSYFGSGGGLYSSGSLMLINCMFIGNSAWDRGGGMGSSGEATLTNCTFSGNSAYLGGGMVSYGEAILNDCTFRANSAGWGGGGMWGGGRMLANCEFIDNSAYQGGGMFCSNDSDLTNCVFIGNLAETGAGFFAQDCDVTLTNCTFSGNLASYVGGVHNDEGDTTVSNCILWGNIDNGGTDESAQIETYDPPSANYCCIQGWTGVLGGTGNIGADPCFVDPANGDYHLLLSSPCVNTGDPNFIAEPDQTDIDGHPRVIDGRIDMGADEVVIAVMKFTPQALNPGSEGNWVKAHLVLPPGFTIEDVNTDSPATLVLGTPYGEPLGIESDHINVCVNEDGLVEVEISFDRSAFCSAAADGLDRPIELTVVGVLTSGQYFYGTDTIRIITNNRRYLAVFASHWLEGTCSQPDWCGGVDLDHSSTVDFVDFAMFDGCCIEVIAQ